MLKWSGMNPMLLRTAWTCRTTSRPNTRTAPCWGFMSVQIIFSVVVFPAPFGPTNPWIVPGATENSIRWSARCFL